MLRDEEREAIEWLKRLVKLNKRDNLDDTFAEILLNLIEKQSKEIDKLKEIVDECIPKKENIITRELEYTPNANANSYLTQEILLLLKEE